MFKIFKIGGYILYTLWHILSDEQLAKGGKDSRLFGLCLSLWQFEVSVECIVYNPVAHTHWWVISKENKPPGRRWKRLRSFWERQTGSASVTSIVHLRTRQQQGLSNTSNSLTLWSEAQKPKAFRIAILTRKTFQKLRETVSHDKPKKRVFASHDIAK